MGDLGEPARRENPGESPEWRSTAVRLVAAGIAAFGALAWLAAGGDSESSLPGYRLAAAWVGFALSRVASSAHTHGSAAHRGLSGALGVNAVAETIFTLRGGPGGTTSPGVDDALFVVAGLVAAASLLPLRWRPDPAVPDRAARIEVWSDAVLMLIAISVATVLWLGDIARELPLMEATLIIGVPILYGTPALVAISRVLVHARWASARAMLLVALGWSLLGWAFGQGALGTTGGPAMGQATVDAALGIGAVIAGLGVHEWRRSGIVPSGPNRRGAQRLLAELFPPTVLGVVLVELAIAPDSRLAPGTHAICAAGLVGALVTRQALLFTIAERQRDRAARALDQAAASLDNERAAAERLQEVAEHAHAVFWVIDGDGCSVLYVSPQARATFGIEPSELGANGRAALHEIILPEDRDDTRPCLRLEAGGSHGPCRYRIALPDGEIRHIAENFAEVRGSRGSVDRFVVVSRDETADRARAAQLERLETAIRALGESVMIADRDGLIRFVNPAFEEITGWSAAQAIGRNPRIMRSGEHDAAFYAGLWGTILAGETWSGHMTNRRRNGEHFDAMVTITPISGPGGEPEQFVSVMRDVSRERALEREMREAQRMESIGRLSGGIAHDFNNLLTVINGYTDLVLKSLAPDSPDRESLEEVLRAGTSAAQLTRQLLAFSRRQVMKPRRVDLRDLVDEMKGMFHRLIGEDIELHTEIDAATPIVRVDPTQILQVIANLAVNARDAMPQGGTLRISCGRIEELDEDGDPSIWAVLVVQDSGSGISPEHLSHVFDPFFTTKPVGAGTGLGLSTVHGIVRQAGGEISVDSTPGRGTTFTITLPEAAHESEKAADVPRSSRRSTGGSVLLVEDDGAVRRSVAAMLRQAGYVVRSASSRNGALSAAARGEIDVIVCDVIMPGTSGRQIVDDLEELLGSVPTLFISGYPADVLGRYGILDENVELLRKPFTIDEMTARIEAVRDRASERSR